MQKQLLASALFFSLAHADTCLEAKIENKGIWHGSTSKIVVCNSFIETSSVSVDGVRYAFSVAEHPENNQQAIVTVVVTKDGIEIQRPELVVMWNKPAELSINDGESIQKITVTARRS